MLAHHRKVSEDQKQNKKTFEAVREKRHHLTKISDLSQKTMKDVLNVMKK